MLLHSLAGKPVPPEMLVNVPRLVSNYYTLAPDPADPAQRVAFGTSGHRGTSGRASFNEAHILAVTQAVCERRAARGVTGPLFLGMDTHALSEPALATAVEVLAANGVTTLLQKGLGYTPTPVISHAILSYNRSHPDAPADGIVITPSHNPPDGGGFKYNPPHGGPAGTEDTRAIQDRANELLEQGLKAVRRIPLARALAADTTVHHDYVRPYVDALADALDMDAVRGAGLAIGVDPMGGSGIGFWEPIAETYGLNLTIVNRHVDPAFGFMHLDHDGKVRMDCSSPYAMAGLIELKDRFDVAFGNDPDYDRHGIVTRDGLMQPNHFLCVAVDHLLRTRAGWPAHAAVGRTVVTTALIDRLAAEHGRAVHEVPVGFKWFVDGLLAGTCVFGGEESAGASFLRADGTAWTTDKDGILMDLLAAEIMAVRGRSPSELYADLARTHGEPVYRREDAPATPAQKAAFKSLTPEMVAAAELAGEPILARLTRAPGNDAPIGGLKVAAASGWFAARPSGTEDIYKIYAESFKGPAHLERLLDEARAIVSAAFAAAGA
ncbi:MAG: alpha-D-glucose phosphate-specific phosphoglucomutase [Desulfovibrionaceae bacterium]|jgi:phosphoglucomutase|nr:alpha-D-glucose phosphate-specific phosphoglucomutase [Desulfovibrionaceae bacterium]